MTAEIGPDIELIAAIGRLYSRVRRRRHKDMLAKALTVKVIEKVGSILGSSVARGLDIVFPESCRVCARWLNFDRERTPRLQAICGHCWLAIVRESPWVEWLGAPSGQPFKIVSRTVYSGVVKKLIYKLKYDGDRLLAGDLALLLQSGWLAVRHELDDHASLVVPVPLHVERQNSRGFNQSELLARHVARVADLRLDVKALTRVKRTVPQHGLDRASRRENLAGAFKGNSQRLTGRAVVLVDDIYTSGATLTEAAQTVLACGAKRVCAFTLARALLGGGSPESRSARRT